MGIENIIVHCSNTNHGSVMDIHKRHLDRGWERIAYVGVVGNGYLTVGAADPWAGADGAWEWGRLPDDPNILVATAQEKEALDWDGKSVGVCFVGKPIAPDSEKSLFSMLQMMTAREKLLELCYYFEIPFTSVLGHSEIQPNKPWCPGLNMELFRRYLGSHRYLDALMNDIGVPISSGSFKLAPGSLEP